MKLQWLGALGLAGAFALTFAACGSDEQIGLSGTTSTATSGTTGSGTGTGGTGGDGTGGTGNGGNGGNANGGSGGSGGIGGSGGNANGGAGGSGGNGNGGDGGTGGNGTGGNGAGGGPACVGCGEVVGNGADPALICTMNGPPSSQDLLDALGTCACVTSCVNECGSNICMGMDPDQACQDCLLVGACSSDTQACLNDDGGPPPPPPPCIECDVALNGGDPADLCTMNGPPNSATLFDTFIDCACINLCANECASACNGGAPDAACQTCIGQSCNNEFMECLNDSGGPPPPPPPCDTCGVAVQASDPSNLCTMNGPPSSEDLYTDLFACACGAACVNQCAGACNGGVIDGPCQNCAFTNCNDEVNACLGDM